MDTVTATHRRELEAVRRRRAELRETLDALDQALADDTGLREPLLRLRADFALHVEVTEGDGGLHDAILAGDLRLTNQVRALAAEHPGIAGAIDAALADPTEPAVLALVERLVRHRRRGADLVHEAFSHDLGGGD